VLSHFSLDSAEGGQRIEIAKYKRIENSKFLSDRHTFNSKFIGGDCGVDVTFALWTVAPLKVQVFNSTRQSQLIGVVGDVHSANWAIKKQSSRRPNV
jgi:hypothetical protein